MAKERTRRIPGVGCNEGATRPCQYFNILLGSSLLEEKRPPSHEDGRQAKFEFWLPRTRGRRAELGHAAPPQDLGEGDGRDQANNREESADLRNGRQSRLKGDRHPCGTGPSGQDEFFVCEIRHARGNEVRRAVVSYPGLHARVAEHRRAQSGNGFVGCDFGHSRSEASHS